MVSLESLFNYNGVSLNYVTLNKNSEISTITLFYLAKVIYKRKKHKLETIDHLDRETSHFRHCMKMWRYFLTRVKFKFSLK